MTQTIDAIVEASVLPLSIIIVGIGNSEFQNMDILDADEVPLVSRGKQMARDIVQFVPFNRFRNASTERLAEEVLQELPAQFLSYMKAKQIAPPTSYTSATTTTTSLTSSVYPIVNDDSASSFAPNAKKWSNVY